MRPLWHVKIDLSPASANPRVSAAAALQHVDAAAEYGGGTGGRITGGLQYGGRDGYWGVTLHLIPAVDGVDDGSSTFMLSCVPDFSDCSLRCAIVEQK